MFGGRRRSPQACVRQGWCQKTPTLTLDLAEVLTASAAWGFYFFGNNVLWTTVWNLSIDVSFNLQDGRTLLICPFLASWTAFVCACNGGGTRRASKTRPRAAEVMARSRHFLRVERFRAGHFTWEKWREPIRKVEPETSDWALHTRIPVRIEPSHFLTAAECWSIAGSEDAQSGKFLLQRFFFSLFSLLFQEGDQI